MKTKMSVLTMMALVLALFAPGASAHGNGAYYSGLDVKSAVKNIDKGIEITLSSDDPQIARRLQEDMRYYKAALDDEYYSGNADYTVGDVKIDTKKSDKGIRVTLASDDSQTARQIQADADYYVATLTDEGYYCHHERHTARHQAAWYDCCDCGW